MVGVAEQAHSSNKEKSEQCEDYGCVAFHQASMKSPAVRSSAKRKLLFGLSFDAARRMLCQEPCTRRGALPRPHGTYGSEVAHDEPCPWTICTSEETRESTEDVWDRNG